MRRVLRWALRLVGGLVLLVILGSVVAAKLAFRVDNSRPEPGRYDGTAAMGERMRELAVTENRDAFYAKTTPLSSLLPYYREMDEPPAERKALLQRAQRGELFLYGGKNQEALAELSAAREAARAYKPPTGGPPLFDAHFEVAISGVIAMAHLRDGEQQNCLRLHNRDSCLMPIQGEGIHKVQEPARAAIVEYLAILQREPENMTTRWLLNVAFMTIGEYPAGVPKEQLIPPDVFKSEYPLPRYDNVAPQVGLDVNGAAGGAIADDFDGDGYLDVMLSGQGAGDQLRFFHNNGDGSFVERTTEAGLVGIAGGLNITHADYDNDGKLDVLLLRGGWNGVAGAPLQPASLLHNDGNGHFTDVTVKAGMLALHPSQTAAWADFDNDGFVDVYVGYESFTMSTLMHLKDDERPLGLPSFLQHPAALFHNNGNGTFTNIGASAGVDITGWVKGVAAGDFDNDGRPDLYASILHGDNILFHNDGNNKFTDVTEKAGVANPERSFGTFFFDYDNDGWNDLFVVDWKGCDGPYWETSRSVAQSYLGTFKEKLTFLYKNRHDGTFADVTDETHLARVSSPMGHNYGDLDHDGWLDVYLATGNPNYESLIPNRMFRNADGKVFQDVTTAGNFGHLQKGHGVFFADLDEDGDQDVFAKQGGAFTGDVAHSALFRNPGNGNHWIKLTLEGKRTNRAAIGAVVELVVDGKAGPRSIFSTVSSGGSFGGNSFRRDLGVGEATVIKQLKVRWPTSNTTQTFAAVAVDRSYRLVEGVDTLTPVTLAPFKLGKSP